jgi:hypothetical protein
VSDETITLSFRLDDLDIDADKGVARYSMRVERARVWAESLLSACDGLPPSALPAVGGDG